MKQLFLNVSDGSMKLIDQPMPTVKKNMALVELREDWLPLVERI